MTIYLNCGNLWDNEYLDTVIKWNAEFHGTVRVKALFGSLAGFTPTARSTDRLPQISWADFEQYVFRAQSEGISIRYTLNQSCIESIQDFKSKWDDILKSDIKRLHYVGIHEWTITSPLLVELLREMFPDDFIEVSTIAEVATPEDAKRWLALGANGVNLSTSINRDFVATAHIVNTGIDVSILVNEACLFRCPWRRDCYNLSSHDSWRGEKFFSYYPFRRCTEVRLKYPEEWVKARLVLPQWMKTYQKQLDVVWFKVAYRTHPKEVALPMLRAYMEQDFHGSLLDLWPTIAHLGNTPEPRDVQHISVDELEKQSFLEHFIEHGGKCSYLACDDCRYCHRIYQLATGSK